MNSTFTAAFQDLVSRAEARRPAASRESCREGDYPLTVHGHRSSLDSQMSVEILKRHQQQVVQLVGNDRSAHYGATGVAR